MLTRNPGVFQFIGVTELVVLLLVVVLLVFLIKGLRRGRPR